MTFKHPFAVSASQPPLGFGWMEALSGAVQLAAGHRAMAGMFPLDVFQQWFDTDLDHHPGSSVLLLIPY